MAQTNRIEATVYPMNEDADAISFTVNYVSFVSSPGGQGEGTYGIPAKIGDRDVKEEGLPVTILYVNPANIAALELKRTE